LKFGDVCYTGLT